MIKAVIFDMNGVIIDDEHIHELAFRDVVKQFGVDLDHKTYLSFCAGRTDREGFESIAKKFSIDLPIHTVLSEKSKAYMQLFPKTKKSFPGVIELINKLSNTNLKLGLTSSASRVEVDLVIKEFALTNTFAVTVSADDIHIGKPNPEPYLLTAKKLDLKPSECVSIEDSKNGVLSAKAAGCYCIAITTTHEKKDLADADLVVEKFEQITEEIISNFS